MTPVNTDRIPMRQRPDGIWQLRKTISKGKRMEVSLGTSDLTLARERAAKIVGEHADTVLLNSWAAKIEAGLRPKGWLRVMRANVACRAAKRGGNADLAVLEAIAIRSGGRCEVSGMPFYFGETKKHPRQPSIDRIDSTRGYEPDNLRLVALAVNYCMSHWGEAVFYSVAAAVVAKRLSAMVDVEMYSAKSGSGNR